MFCPNRYYHDRCHYVKSVRIRSYSGPNVGDDLISVYLRCLRACSLELEHLLMAGIVFAHNLASCSK